MRLPLVILLIAAGALAAEPANLLRNGSFEGGLLYWHGVDPERHTLVKTATPAGEHALRIAKGYVMSAPVPLERGQPATVSFWVKGEAAGRVNASMPPSAREVGTKAKRLWMREGAQSAAITTEWQRVSFTWNADVPADGFWPLPHYMVQIEIAGTPILVDGVTVTLGKAGATAYLPRRGVEVVAECPDIPGYEGASMGVFEKGATARVIGHFSNPTDKPHDIAVVWELFDYEGTQRIGAAVQEKITLAPGKTFTRTEPMVLVHTGCVIARVSARELDGTEIDRSELPLTSLPYPKAATVPDYRERFGGSFAGGIGMLQKFQRLGFGWTRWYPETKWHNFQPKGPEDWEPHDEKFALAHRHGVSQHVVLYGWPKWIMDEGGHPLPRDMRWGPEDPRWEDLKLETAWDRFVKRAAKHYTGKSVLFEISNEPELDKWDEYKTEYAKFNIRTAKLLREADPKARIMVDNVYGIPSGLNSAFFKAGGLKFIDYMSWHDYHAGGLTDAVGIRRMRQNMDEAGGKHVEIWFNEGWAFTNTAVDEPLACTSLTAVQSTHAQMNSVAEMTVSGQEKTILFHTGYEKHGMSFWDYSGPGTMLWDWYNYPLPLVAAWNVMAHHIGISDEVGFVRPPGANFCIFQDARNGRGVCIAYADREAKEDATVDMAPILAAMAKLGGKAPVLQSEDLMGNVAPAPERLTLSKTGRPAILYTSNALPGAKFLEALAPLDRKNASFVTQAGPGESPSWALPPVWDGKTKGDSAGSIAMADGKPVWKLEQVWPPQLAKRENYRPMVWTGTDWNVKEDGMGGQPGAALKDGTLTFGTRAPHGTPPALRTAALVFVAPRAGTYEVAGSVETRIWEGTNKTDLHVLRRTPTGMVAVGDFRIDHRATQRLDGAVAAQLEAGDELVFVPQIQGMFAGGDTKFRDLRVTLKAGGSTTPVAPIFRLPLAWEGAAKGSTDGNPAVAAGKPVWRLDQVWPDDPVFVANYLPLRWSGTDWRGPQEYGGQPAVRVENGGINFAVRAAWTGQPGQRIAALAFIAPKTARYRLTADARSKPWEGGAETYRLAIFKKDAQRSAQQQVFELPRSGEAVKLDVTLELSEGHELIILPLMGSWHNATNTSVEGLSIVEEVR